MAQITFGIAGVRAALVALGLILGPSAGDAAGQPADQMHWYVDDDAPPGGDGQSWETALDQLQPAIDAAPDGATVHIAPGTYAETLVRYERGITLQGAGVGETVLTGDLNGDGLAETSVLNVYVTLAPPPVFIELRDLTVRHASLGVNIDAAISSLRLADVEIESCGEGVRYNRVQNLVSIERSSFRENGAGLISSWLRAEEDRPELFITDSRFVANSTAIHAYAGDSTIESVVFDQNERCGWLRGFDVSVSDLRVVNSVDEGVSFDGTNVIVADSEFENNAGTALDLSGGDLRVVRSEFVGIEPPEDETATRGIHVLGTTHSVLIQDCSISGFRGGGGADIRFPRTLRVQRCRFEQNHTHQSGGGLQGYGLDVEIDDCVFIGNEAKFGGGVMLNVAGMIHGGSAVIRRSQFVRNRSVRNGYWDSESAGGGICIEGFSDRGAVTIEECDFLSNTADAGGAVIALEGPLAVERSVFLGNHAFGTEFYGKAHSIIFHGSRWLPDQQPQLIVSESVFMEDTAEGSATITADWTRSWAVMANNLFLTDSMPYALAGRSYPSRISDENYSNIVVGASAGGGPVFSLFQDPSNVVSRDAGPLRFSRLPSDGGDGWGDDPSTPEVNEGANDDFGDLRLTAGSIAIDAGDASAVPEFDLDGPDYDMHKTEPVLGGTDAAGQPRFVDDPLTPDRFPSAARPAIDAGPFEYQAPARVSPADWLRSAASGDPAADLNADGVVDGADLRLLLTHAP